MTEGMATIKLKYVTGDVDRHGNVRWYFRRPGQRKIRLPGYSGSVEFMAAYQAALSGDKPPNTARAPLKRAATGTLRWLCIEYYQSAAFRQLAPRTQQVRRLFLDKACEAAGDELLSNITRFHILKGRDRRAATPEQANTFLKAMRHLFAYALEFEYVNVNPAAGVPKLTPKGDGWHSWTVEEVRQFEARHPLGTKARLALALLLYTGQRRGDVVQMGRQHIRDALLTLRQGKTGASLTLPVLPELQDAIDAGPTGNMTFLVTEFGKPFTSNGFGNRFRKWCDEAGLKHCSAHGLRKAGAVIAAENGATERQLMAIFGWKSIKMAEHYTKAADQKRLAGEAMSKLIPGQDRNKSVPLSTPVSQGGTNTGRKMRKINAK
jgi:integrase